MKITHIGPESQFFSFAAGTFDAVAPGSGEHFVLRSSAGDRGSYGMDRLRTHIVQSKMAALPALARAVRSSDLVVAHSMSPFAAIAFALSRKRTLRMWSGWGYDYYGTDVSADAGLLAPLTAELADRHRSDQGTSSSRISAGARVKNLIGSRLIHRAAARTDLFSAPIPSDLEIFRRRFPEFNGEYSQLSYASIEHTFTGMAGVDKPRDIQVGNSATFSNNHLDIFGLLAELDLNDRRIVVPLSYGDAAYRDAIVERGERTLGAAFVPLLNFMPLDEYLATISTCNVVIMNHRRQQAVGNVCAAIYGGAHVYLDSSNPLLQFLRSLGTVVHSTAELSRSRLPAERQPADILATNRAALESFWGSAAVRANVESVVRRIEK